VTSGWERDVRARGEQRRAEVGALPTVTARHHATLSPASWQDRIVTASIGPAGEAIALWETATGAGRVTVDGTDGRTQVIDIEHVPPGQLTVQPMPQGRVLVVAARCPWGQHNAVVYDGDGRVERTASLGDGVAHVLCTAEGAVWVGYAEEGILGSRLPVTVTPVGAPGIVRFDADLNPQWSYDGQEWGRVDDCDALNVDGDTVWTCYYSRIALVRIHDGATLGWHNPVASGASGILIDDRWVAFFGGYGTNLHRLVVASLEGGTVNALREFRMTVEDGQPLPAGRVVGRGAQLHLLAGRDWYRFTLADLA
jgi:hypothetical protein